ncbi:hypothetical protein OIU84_010500 [Salix udensis]|uniref:AP180 N-terminal homology (ANTH) domain-containing protein n=1 Tax=Salix udensis TaxID=889485 RepID=A0AAD6NVY2_9ROSI|nr:hypothetical protein OIU84_010500 [Salix udensis]
MEETTLFCRSILKFIRVLDIYKKAESQGEKLPEFSEFFRGLDFGLGQSFVKIEQPPPSFINAMEDYVTEAPHVIALQCTATAFILPGAEDVVLVAPDPDKD